jgi:ligand-binding sensor domain-containing protein/serine phosphatase RsbU (regulator of sigma subunit)
MLRLRVFFLLLFFSNHVFSQESDLKFEHTDIHQGLSNNQVKCILQDSYGFLWVGTRDGLNKYDGHNFTIYRPRPDRNDAISANEILCISEDKKKNLWVGTLTGGLSLYDRKNDNFTNFLPDKNNKNTILSQNVYAILEDSFGFLWVGTDKGLSRLSPDRKAFKHFLPDSTQKQAISDKFVTAIFEDSNRNLWIGTKHGGINLYQPEKETFISYTAIKNEGLCGEYISSITEDKQGNLILGTYSGLTIAKKNQTHLTDFYCFTNDPANPNSLSNTQNGFVLYDNGLIWVCDNNSAGLNVVEYKYDIENKPVIERIKKYLHTPLNPQSLASNRMRCIYKDRTGIYWIGTEMGLDKFVPSKQKFQHVYNYMMLDPNGLNNNEIRAFVEDENQTIWVATYGNGLSSYSPQTGKVKSYPYNFKNKDALKSRQMLSGSEGLLWVTTSGGGFYAFDMPNKKYTYHFEYDAKSPYSLMDNAVGAIYEDQEKTLWVGTESGLCKLTYENRARGKFENLRHFTDDKINTIIEDSKGSLWIATETNGIIRMKKDGSEKTTFKHDAANPKSLPQDNVRLIYRDEKNRIWVGTGAGLCLFESENSGFTIYNEKDGFPNSVINGVLQESKNFWISTNDGLLRFNPETKKIHHYTEADGLQSNEFRKRSFYKGKSGKLYFGGLNGFNFFYPNQIKSDTSKPTIMLTDFKIFNKSVLIGENSPLRKHISLTDELLLSYQDYVISLEFAALHFNNPSNNLYAYKLENFEKDWNYVNAQQRFATYTNLDAGTYFFKVKAANADGFWGEKERTLKIVIKPPFWETAWFITLVITVIVGGAVGFYKYRINQVEAQKKKLEVLVSERTTELSEEKKSVETKNLLLEKQSEEILNKNTELEQTQEEIVSQRDFIEKKNTELVDTLYLLNLKNQKITSSIRYAQTIQQAILPTEKRMKKYFNDFFVLYRPKDIVSGDFYWIAEERDKSSEFTFIAVADCTGHGVAGAFMSMIGYSLLNELVRQRKVLDPAKILTELDEKLREALTTDESTKEDGMDICLCRLEAGKNKTKVVFSGAKRPLYYLQNAQLEEIRGDRKSIGGTQDMDKAFQNQEIILNNGSMLYLFSDGYCDQKDAEGNKLGSRKFKEMMMTVSSNTPKEQCSYFDTTLQSYLQHYEQRDDITIVGIRV